jgi:recombination protein RecR
MRYPQQLNRLIEHLKKLPGVGSKSAERFAFQIITWQEKSRNDFAELIANLGTSLSSCSDCGSLCDQAGCLICLDSNRNRALLCVVVSQKEVFAFEQTGQFKGLYHVLGTLFSPMNSKFINNEKIDKLQKRIEEEFIEEVIVAIDATLEGDATALYIKDNLKHLPVKVSRIAFGLPQNCSLEFVDGSTLSYALRGRSTF